MTALRADKDVCVGIEFVVRYTRHRPEQTRLYQLVQTHYPAFVAELAARERITRLCAARVRRLSHVRTS